MRFSALSLFSWISFTRTPEYPIAPVPNFFENSRRYSRMYAYQRYVLYVQYISDPTKKKTSEVRWVLLLLDCNENNRQIDRKARGWVQYQFWPVTALAALIKKKIKFSSYLRKFRVEQLQSHIWLTATSYMGKYLRISSYISGSPSSYMTLQLLHFEFPYLWGKVDFLFCSVDSIPLKGQ